MSLESEGSHSCESDVEEAWKEIIEKVKSTPTIVFSVIGDSDSFVPTPWAKSVFQTALIEAAKNGGDTWILYRGRGYGVSSIVQDAYREYGDMEFRIKSRDIAIDDTERHVKLIKLAGNIKSQNAKENKHKIIPDPTEAECSVEPKDSMAFLLDFEKYLSTKEVPLLSQTIDIKLPIPIVILACEGDLDTIQHIAEALKRKIPVIIIKGSGKAADLILDYMENKDLFKENARILFGTQFGVDTYQRVTEHLKEISETYELISVFDVNSDDCLMLSNIVGRAIVNCWATENILRNRVAEAKMKKQETIFREKTLQFPRNNESVVVSTCTPSSVGLLFKSNAVMPEQKEMKKGSQNIESRIHVLDTKYTSPTSLPLNFYFEYQFLQELGKLKKHGHVLLFEALICNRSDYVQVLLDQGVQLRQFSLLDLYEKTISKTDGPLQWILKQFKEGKPIGSFCNASSHIRMQMRHKELELRDLKKRLKEEDFKNIENIRDEINQIKKEIKHLKDDFSKEQAQTDVSESAKRLFREIMAYSTQGADDIEATNEVIEDEEIRENSCYVKFSDILLWAIFTNRKEIAEIFWLRTTNHLFTGLVCTALLRILTIEAKQAKRQNLSREFDYHALLFEDRYLAIMDSMHTEDEESAIDLMDDEANLWGITSCPLDFAHDNFLRNVVAHDCSYRNMYNQWYNNLGSDKKTFLKAALWNKKKFFTAPFSRYIFNYVIFLAMLVIFSHFVLSGIGDDTARVYGYFIYLWGAGDLIEQIIIISGILESRRRSHRRLFLRLRIYAADFWNFIAIYYYLFLFFAILFRCVEPTPNYTRKLFSLSLLFMFLRFLEVFRMHKAIGTILIIIREMIRDLKYFLIIAFFVVLGVGIYYHANLWPDHPNFWSGSLADLRIWKVFYYPYWQLYGETNNEFLEGGNHSSCTNNETVWMADTSIERCAKEDKTIFAVSALHVLFSNLLLVNLVIAMFSNTFERIQENARSVWTYSAYTVICDFKKRLPSPINLLFLPRLFVSCFGRKMGSKNKFRGCFRNENEIHRKQQIYRTNFQRNTAFRLFNKVK